ncbi:diacylglycerol/lipid kinase family protein [Fodinicurvata halophila]|uniref:diacylglycerol/lipid kinase family protein n=1 Tax=Fodinicurvata halophila TaxID=1419723 RepID=UPI00362743F1
MIYNPAAGLRQRRTYAAIVEQLQLDGCEILEMPTRHAGHGEEIARQLTPDACDRVVAAGGDGTVNEVANGLLANTAGGRTLPLALLPLGTANVLARELGVLKGRQAIATCIRGGKVRPVAVGRANGRHFLLMAGVGFDAHVVAGISPALKRRVGKLAYVAETCRQLFVYRFPGFRLDVDGQEVHACSAIVANAHYYGGRFVVAPEALLEAPSLQVCLFTRSGRLHAMKYAAALVLGLLPRLPDIRYLEARRIQVLGPGEDPVQGDGDILAALPCDIVVLPDALNLIFPD